MNVMVSIGACEYCEKSMTINDIILILHKNRSRISFNVRSNIIFGPKEGSLSSFPLQSVQ